MRVRRERRRTTREGGKEGGVKDVGARFVQAYLPARKEEGGREVGREGGRVTCTWIRPIEARQTKGNDRLASQDKRSERGHYVG